MEGLEEKKISEMEETPTPEVKKASPARPGGKSVAQKIKEHEGWLLSNIKKSNQLDENLLLAQETLKKLQSEHKQKKEKIAVEMDRLKIKLYDFEHGNSK